MHEMQEAQIRAKKIERRSWINRKLFQFDAITLGTMLEAWEVRLASMYSM